MMRIIIILLCAMSFSQIASAQQQLLLMKKGRIIGRFNPGDEIRFELKDQRKIAHHTAIMTIRQFDFITINKDTIEFSRIHKIKFKSANRAKLATSHFIAGAALVGLSYLLEPAFGDGNKTSVQGVRFVGIYAIAYGSFMMLTRNTGIKLNGIKRLKSIPYDSPLYR